MSKRATRRDRTGQAPKAGAGVVRAWRIRKGGLAGSSIQATERLFSLHSTSAGLFRM